MSQNAPGDMKPVSEQDLCNVIYSGGAEMTGKSEKELRKMAEQVFATMMFHAAANEGHQITTTMLLATGRIEVEVNVFGRKPTKLV